MNHQFLGFGKLQGIRQQFFGAESSKTQPWPIYVMNSYYTPKEDSILL